MSRNRRMRLKLRVSGTSGGYPGFKVDSSRVFFEDVLELGFLYSMVATASRRDAERSSLIISNHCSPSSVSFAVKNSLMKQASKTA